MNTALIYHRPEIPALPPPGQPVLIRVVTAEARQMARQELRTVLREMLAAWSQIFSEQLPLRETASGPVWSEQLGGHNLDISLSYAEGEAWIGLLRGGFIGVDVMRIQLIPEAEAVARHYLDSEALRNIQQSTDPALAFAKAWTVLEARLKCLKQPLRESAIIPVAAAAKCDIQSLVQPDRLMVTVATSGVHELLRSPVEELGTG
jgi:4'-phosphopantetheinyl transferase